MALLFRILVVAFFILGNTFILYSQNLIPNADFEEYYELPTNWGQWYKMNYWNNLNYDSTYFPLRSGSPDFFHMQGSGSVELPNITGSYINPKHGAGIAGLGVIFTTASDENYREYLNVKFNDTLMVGKHYYLILNISNGQFTGAACCGFGINSFGILFSTYQPVQLVDEPLSNLAPQLIISDTLYNEEWQRFVFDFVADSLYEYLTLGNFKNDDSTYYQIFNGDSMENGAYYFIDSLYLGERITNSENEINAEENYVKIFPNPALEKIKINSEITFDKWTIYDLSSKRIAQNSLKNENSFEIDVSFLNAGVYYIRLETRKGSIVKKIIKQNL